MAVLLAMATLAIISETLMLLLNAKNKTVEENDS
jgi:hypothetical protein